MGEMLNTMKKEIIIFICMVCFYTVSAAAETGKGVISGTVVEAETGDPLIGVNVYLEGTTFGAATLIGGALR